ncbi:MAG: hypothetical protein C3F11_17300 [Methylocystaceae bacterium]|nr:MAG: hypothetical protein C3F11_17300 [Methylocystaceae bacterium]
METPEKYVEENCTAVVEMAMQALFDFPDPAYAERLEQSLIEVTFEGSHPVGAARAAAHVMELARAMLDAKRQTKQ